MKNTKPVNTAIDLSGHEPPNVVDKQESVPRNLYEKINDMKADFGALEKDGTNSHFKYDYVTEAQVMQKLSASCIKHRVCIIPDVSHATNDGKLTTINVGYMIVDTDNPEDKILLNVPGTGNATDKGLYAAMTGSYKYFAIKLFQLATDSDPENDTKHPEKPAYEGHKRPAPRPVGGITKMAKETPQTPVAGFSTPGGMIDEPVLFGKFKGQLWSELNENYLEWLSGQDGKFRDRAIMELEARRATPDPTNGMVAQDDFDSDDLPGF